MDCKKGSTYQGKTVCASVADPDNTYCAAESTAQDRCGKCGFFWSGKECLTQNPVEKAKKELKEEEEKKKAAEKKDGVPATNASAPKTGPSSVKTTPITPPANPSQPGPDEDQIYNRKDMSKTKGLDSGE